MNKEIVSIRPVFDMELLLETLGETRIGGAVMESLAAAWERWLPVLHGIVLGEDSERCLVIWLEESVEEEVDKNFAESPTTGFRLHTLAQTLCMGAVYQVLPDVAEAGCAPAPAPEKWVAALAAEGIPFLNPSAPTLCRRFSVLTPYPFRGACEICFLRADCPRAKGQGAFHSVVLPGEDS